MSTLKCQTHLILKQITHSDEVCISTEVAQKRVELKLCINQGRQIVVAAGLAHFVDLFLKRRDDSVLRQCTQCSAIRDVTRRGDIVLDGFGGSGTTLIAAERTGRVARLIELDPLYCDVICRRFEALTGQPARLAGTDQAFADVALDRAAEADTTTVEAAE